MHMQGCPCNGFGGQYANCTCALIIQRQHTAELERFNNTPPPEVSSIAEAIDGIRSDLAYIREKIEKMVERDGGR